MSEPPQEKQPSELKIDEPLSKLVEQIASENAELTTPNHASYPITVGTGQFAGIHQDFLHLISTNWAFIYLGLGFIFFPMLVYVLDHGFTSPWETSGGLIFFPCWVIGGGLALMGWLAPPYNEVERAWQKEMTTTLQKFPEQHDITIFIDKYVPYTRAQADRCTSIEADGTTVRYKLLTSNIPLNNLPRRKKFAAKVVRSEVGKDAIFIGEASGIMFRLWCQADSTIAVPDELKVHHYNVY